MRYQCPWCLDAFDVLRREDHAKHDCFKKFKLSDNEKDTREYLVQCEAFMLQSVKYENNKITNYCPVCHEDSFTEFQSVKHLGCMTAMGYAPRQQEERIKFAKMCEKAGVRRDDARFRRMRASYIRKIRDERV